MNWDYETKLKSYIVQAQNDSGMTDYLFEVCNEQIFVKKKTLDPNTIYVVVKYLSSTNTLNAVTQPIQILVSCEQNQIQASQIVFSKLVDSHNFEAVIDGGTYIKQDYRQPVVLSNFNEVSYGYRTLMYISATLFIMENVMDIEDFSIRTGVREFRNLSAAQASIKDDWFNGDYPGEVGYSPEYIVDTNELTNLTDAIGLGWIVDDQPIMYVDGTLCYSFRFHNDRAVLLNGEGVDIKTIYYSQQRYITIQFYGPEDVETADHSFINYADYSQLFPDIVTQYVYDDRTYDEVKPISFVMSYSMTPNTQPIPPQRIATSVKSVSTFSVTLGVPLISDYQFITVCNKIAAGIVSGNISFVVSFKLGSVEFNNVPMKLVSSQITTAINEVPGLQIGLIK